MTDTARQPPGRGLDDPIGALHAALEKARATEAESGPAAALAVLEAAPPELNAFATFHFARGALLFRTGKIDPAIDAFREAVRLEPGIGEYRANLGAALIERYRRSAGAPGAPPPDAAALEEALAALEGAARAGAKSAFAWNDLGLALQLAGRLDESLEALDRALEIEPRDVSALYNRAATLHRLGREADCLACLDRALEVDPSFAPAIESRRNTLRRLGRA